jgi:four helix bundle protein
MKDFRELKVWHKAHSLALAVYRGTKNFPQDERFGLTAQMRRAAVSIPSNIAEGCGRATDRDLARFCTIAAGSATELKYQLLLAKDLGFLKDDEHNALVDMASEVTKMIHKYTDYLSRGAGRSGA